MAIPLSLSSGSTASDTGSDPPASPLITPPRIRKIFNPGYSLSILPILAESPTEGSNEKNPLMDSMAGDARSDPSSSPSVTPPRIRKIFNRSRSLSTLPPLAESPLEGAKQKSPFTDRQVCDAERTYSIATKRQPKVFIKVPMDNFVGRCIPIPVVTFVDWNKKVIEVLLAEAVKTDFSDAAIEGVVNDMSRHCLDHSSILRRVGLACELLSGSSAYAFLNDFIQDGRPVIFWNKYEALKLKSSQDFNLLYEVMGRQEAFMILRMAAESNGKKIKRHFRSQIDAVAFLEKKKQALFNCSISFPNALDPSLLRFAKIPHFAQNYKEFGESFRSFLSNGPFPKKSIRFNGECLIIPDYKSLELEDSDREEHFIKWLISEFQQKMNIDLAPDPKAQIQSFAMAPKLDPKFERKHLRPLIVKSLRKEFKMEVSPDNFGKKLECFFSNFQKETADFSVQLRPFSEFLGVYLRNSPMFKEKDWGEVSKVLISWYGRLYQLKEKHVSIPSLSLLLSMGYPSYAVCAQFLNGIGRPSTPFGDSNSYRLVLNRDEIGSYDILFKKGCFNTIHIKWFNVVYNQIVKAKVLIHWNVSGMLKSSNYSFHLSTHDARFSSECGEDESLMILDQLSLALQNVKEAGFNGIVTLGSRPSAVPTS